MARLAALFLSLLLFASCAHRPDPATVVMAIENSPTNLDPRIGTDAQSERIAMLLFDSLLRRDEHFNLQPSLAVSWEIPDPLTYIFHLRAGVRFHDGRPLTARDVKWTIDSMRDGTVRSTRSATYQWVSRIDAPDDATVIFHLSQPFAALLWNLSDGAIGVIPYGSGPDFSRDPIGSGPFRFQSLQQDKEVVLVRNPDYWDATRRPRIERVRFAVIPDATTRALEMRKGSAHLALTAFSPDVIATLRDQPSLAIQQSPGTIYGYLAFNLRDPVLSDVRVRRAVAYALDRSAIIQYLWRDEVHPANSILPPQSWAFSGDVTRYDHDPARAIRLLDEAGYRPGTDGIRLHLTIKTSTEEFPRLIAAVFQQQLRQVGIELTIRSLEFGTFFSDITNGAFQLYSLRWIGANQDPDIFEYVFDSASFPPRRANRGFYSNPQVDSLIAQGRSTLDQRQRAAVYAQIQRIVAQELPYVSLWYFDNVLVYNRRLNNLHVAPSGDYGFLTTMELVK